MIYPIYVYGMPVLRKRASEIAEDYEGLDQLIADMFETMYASDGVGLAAPQIGLSIRLTVIDAAPLDDEEDPTIKDFKKVLINPEIVKEEGGEWTAGEGCLSLPNIREDVIRKHRIRVAYQDRDFNPVEEIFEDVRARIVHHEIDHLDGILITDRIAPLKKRLLTGRLKDISRGKADVDYKIVFPKK